MEENSEISTENHHDHESSPSSSSSSSSTKNTYSIGHGDTIDNINDEAAPENKILSNCFKYGKHCKIKIQDAAHPDIVAMSVLSLYDKDTLETDMDTEKDALNSPEITNNDVNFTEANENLLNDNAQDNICENKCSKDDCSKTNIFFRDGERSVDFILVWDMLNKDSVTDEAYERRRIFERNLVKEGLDLEYEPVEDNGLNFIKIHAPVEVLRCYSEILKLRMPMKDIPGLRSVQTRTNYIMETLNSGWETFKSYILVDRNHFPERGQRFTAVYSRDKEYL